MGVSSFPALIVAVFGGIAALLLGLLSLRGLRWAFGLMILFASISITVDYYEQVYQTVWLPLQAYRSELTGYFGILLGAGLLIRLRDVSFREISALAWLLAFFGIYTGLVRMYHTDVGDGAATVLYGLILTLPLAVFFSAYFRSAEDALTMFRVILLAGAIMTAMVVVQLVVNRSLLVIGIQNRFTALIGNSNQAATMLSVFSTLALWMSVHGPARGRLPYGALTAVFVVMLLWTGSRGGFALFVVGSTATLYSRAGRAILLLPVLGLILYLLVKITQMIGIDLGSERLLEVSDTRSAAWRSLLKGIASSPWIGVGPTQNRGSENSYLLAWSLYGVGAFLIVLMILTAGIVQGLRLWRVRWRLDKTNRALADLCIGHLGIFFLGALVEGFMTSRVGVHPLFMVMFAALANHLIYRVPQLSEEALEAEAAGEYSDEVWDETYDAIPPYGEQDPAAQRG